MVFGFVVVVGFFYTMALIASCSVWVCFLGEIVWLFFGMEDVLIHWAGEVYYFFEKFLRGHGGFQGFEPTPMCRS